MRASKPKKNTEQTCVFKVNYLKKPKMNIFIVMTVELSTILLSKLLGDCEAEDEASSDDENDVCRGSLGIWVYK